MSDHPTSPSMDDRRDQPRIPLDRREPQRERTFLTGLAIFPGEEIIRRVLILNRSDKGAKIRAEGIFVPNQFTLVDEKRGAVHKVRVIWRDMPVVGLAYIETVDVKAIRERTDLVAMDVWTKLTG